MSSNIPNAQQAAFLKYQIHSPEFGRLVLRLEIISKLESCKVDIESEPISDVIRKWDGDSFEQWQGAMNVIQPFTDVNLTDCLDRSEFDRVLQSSSITSDTCKFETPPIGHPSLGS